MRNAATDKVLAVSTATLLNMDLPARMRHATIRPAVHRRDTKAGVRAAPAPPDAADQANCRQHAMKLRLPHSEALGPASEGGFILVVVLWILAALAALASSYSVYVGNAAFATQVNDDRLRIRNGISTASS